MSKMTPHKECYCHTCEKNFHYLGIARHRAMHRDRFEDCKITYTNGDTAFFEYSKNKCYYNECGNGKIKGSQFCEECNQQHQDQFHMSCGYSTP